MNTQLCVKATQLRVEAVAVNVVATSVKGAAILTAVSDQALRISVQVRTKNQISQA